MSSKTTETISSYDALYAVRTGLTILIPKHKTFDGGVEIPVQFKISPDNPRDIMIMAADQAVLLKELKKEYLDAAIAKGVIMFYEMVEDEVVRCTPCSYSKS